MKKIDIFIDSGAFSAHTKGTVINIDDYIAFIKENEKDITLYSNLDVIGDAEASHRNQLYMEDRGLVPLPCFHMGEDFKYLERYVRDYDYIALGGVAQAMNNKRLLVSWLNHCWRTICDADGYPKTRVHGFAITTLSIMFRYPWYSVDSTSWMRRGRFGAIYVPKERNGKHIYDANPLMLYVSNQSPTQKDEGKHFRSCNQMEQDMILRYVHSKGFAMGRSRFEDGEEIVEEPGIANDYKLRDAMNILYFIDLEKNMPPYPQRWVEKNIRRFDFGG